MVRIETVKTFVTGALRLGMDDKVVRSALELAYGAVAELWPWTRLRRVTRATSAEGVVELSSAAAGVVAVSSTEGLHQYADDAVACVEAMGVPMWSFAATEGADAGELHVVARDSAGVVVPSEVRVDWWTLPEGALLADQAEVLVPAALELTEVVSYFYAALADKRGGETEGVRQDALERWRALVAKESEAWHQAAPIARSGVRLQ